MRNLGTRFNASNVISLFGNDNDELAKATAILLSALETDLTQLTPSEERVVDGLLMWYKSLSEKPRLRLSPAYAYVNLNTGINLLFLNNSVYDPVIGLEIALMDRNGVEVASKCLVPDDYD